MKRKAAGHIASDRDRVVSDEEKAFFERRKYNMKEHETIDTAKYDYEQITDDDVWTYHEVENAGVIKLNAASYEAKIMTNKK